MYTRGALFFVLVASGCLFPRNDPGRTGIVDDLPSTFLVEADVRASEGEDQLHAPYLRGAAFVLRISFSGDVDNDWKIESSAPSVLSIDRGDGRTGSFLVTARAAGQTELRILDGDRHIKSSRTVRVQEADGIRVIPYSESSVGERAKPIDEARILAGSTVRFVLRATAGDDVLSGRGNIGLAATPGARLVTESRGTEILVLSPVEGSDPVSTVGVAVNDVVVGIIKLESVTADAVARIELHPQSEVGAEIGDELRVLARAYDAEDHPIYGTSTTFADDSTLGHCGSDCTGEGGDVFLYTFDPRRSFALEAQTGELVDGVELHGTPGLPPVFSDGDCSAAPGAPRAGRLALVLVLGTLALLLRRRRATCACWR